MSEKSLKPEIRFAGFTENWEQHKAGEIFLTTTDKNHPELPVLSASQEYGMIKRDEAGINIYHDKRNETTYKRVLPGQFVIHLRSFQGGFAHSTIEGITSPAYTVLDFIEREKNYDFFWKYILNSELFVKRLETVTYGIRDGRSISYEDFTAMKFSYPDYDEQHKIGLFFKRLDNLITLHQRKCEKLVNFKKAMLEKMFPKDGTDMPEIRFAGFTGAWEQRKLGDVVLITMGQSPDGNTYSNTPTNYILVQGNADLKSGWVTPRVWTSQVTKKAEVGDLIMSVRAPAGAMGKTAYNVVIGRGVAAIKGNEFIFQSLVKMNMEGYWTKISCGSTFESLNSDDIKNAELMIPTLNEQIRIGLFFNSLDNLLTLQQRELEQLKQIKKSLLDKMFV